MKSYKIEINVGDLVNVGRFRNVETPIKGIEVDENGQPVILTSKGKKKLFSCRLVKLSPGSKTPRQILLEKKKNKKKKRAEESWNGML
jgi:hypothetical protein